MSPRFQSPPSLVVPIALAIFGVAYCSFVYLGVGESICVTAGCSLYKSFTLFGISMWIFGIVAFVLLTLLMAAGAYALSLLLARLCLIGDCILLLVMATTSPCLSCLGVALVFALIYFLLRRSSRREERRRSVLLCVWSLLFVSNLVLSGREMFPPEPIYGTAEAPVHIYFSPTCEKCLKAMEMFDLGDGQVAYYATSRGDVDIAMLIALRNRLGNGERMPEALRAVKRADPADLPQFSWASKDDLLLQWQLLRNKAVVIASTGGTVPFITINGVPTGSSTPQILPGDELGSALPEATPHEPDQQRPESGGAATFIHDATAPATLFHSRNATAPEGGSFSLEPDNAGSLFGNATGFATCTDENPETCD